MRRDMPPRSSDTDVEAERVQLELLRAATPGDVIGVIKVAGQSLDRGYLSRWAAELGVIDLLERALMIGP